jgi:Ca2+-binding RTX toxin-like protein
MTSFVIDTTTSTGRGLSPGEYGAVLEGGAIVLQANGVGVNNATLYNAGTIFTPGAAAVVGNGDVTLTNAAGGTITGGWALLQLGGTGTFHSITNAGLMQGSFSAIELNNAATVFLANTGTITASSFNTVAINASSTVRITNDGTIAGSGFSTGISLSGSASAKIINNGLLSAEDAVFVSGTGTTNLLNTGTIIGDITLGVANDFFSGRSGDQTQSQVSGGDGNDTLDGGALADQMAGDGGTDVLRGNAGDDGLQGGDGNDTMRGGDGDDGMDGGLNDDRMRGNNGNDDLAGGDGNDDLGGGDGGDFIDGGGGSDLVRGGDGDDELVGGSGSDTLSGGRGNDLLNGGNSADVFEFARGHGDDAISAFQNGTDRIDLRAFHFAVAADVIALAGTTSTGLSIDLTSKGGGEILITSGLTLAQLDAGDLIL